MEKALASYSRVYPSGFDFATARCPYVPPGPLRFRIRKDCPRDSLSLPNRIRLIRSAPPPVGYGTMTWTGLASQALSAYASWEMAVSIARAAAPFSACRRVSLLILKSFTRSKQRRNPVWHCTVKALERWVKVAVLRRGDADRVRMSQAELYRATQKLAFGSHATPRTTPSAPVGSAWSSTGSIGHRKRN